MQGFKTSASSGVKDSMVATTITTSTITSTTIMTSSTINLSVEATTVTESTTVLTAIEAGEEKLDDFFFEENVSFEEKGFSEKNSDFSIIAEKELECELARTQVKGFGLCAGNGLVTELVLIAMISTNLLLAFCSPVVLAIERVRVEKMVREYWYVKRRKEECKRAREGGVFALNNGMSAQIV